MSLKTCSDMAEAIPLEPSLGLYLKPISRIKINVQLPRLNAPGQSISSWHVMEKLKETVRPDAFLYLKSLKIASNVIKFEGELETKTSCERALARLKASGNLKVSGFSERLQIRAAHAACSGPTRHDWEAYFRDAKGVNEMKPGERPDTIHLEEIPVRWFAETSKSTKPSEKLLQKAFGTFGKIRRLEIQRNALPQDNTFVKTSSMHSDLTFEAYIQYEEYVEFSIAMDSLRGKKLLYKEPDGKVYSADIKVDFDRTNYLSDKCIKIREAEAKKMHCTSDITKTPKGDTDKQRTSPGNEKGSVFGTEVKSGKTTDKNLRKKEKTDGLHLEDREKTMKEAKLLIKELLHRAEKCKREVENKPEEPFPSFTSQESHKNPKELKKSTKKPKAELPEICVEPKTDKDCNLGFLDGKKPEKHPSKSIPEHTQDLKHSKEWERNAESKETEVSSEKKRMKGEDSNCTQKPAKKQKTTPELSKVRRKETQPFYEVDKVKSTHKDKVTYTKRQDRTFSYERTDQKDSSTHPKQKHLEDGKNNREKEPPAIPPGSVPGEDRKNREKLILQERILKEKLLKNLKAREEEKLRRREKLRRELAGRRVLKSVLVDKNHSLPKRS